MRCVCGAGWEVGVESSKRSHVTSCLFALCCRKPQWQCKDATDALNQCAICKQHVQVRAWNSLWKGLGCTNLCLDGNLSKELGCLQPAETPDYAPKLQMPTISG
eukprot:3064061-Rhodomonas_salina.1